MPADTPQEASRRRLSNASPSHNLYGGQGASNLICLLSMTATGPPIDRKLAHAVLKDRQASLADQGLAVA